MCDYCNSIYSMVAKIPIIDCEINLGDIGKAKLGAYIKSSDFGTFIDMAIDNYGYGASTIRRTAEIFYCPKCGRKLGGQNERKGIEIKT